MSNNNDSNFISTITRKILNRLLHHFLAVSIKRGSGLIKNNNLRPFNQRPRNGNPLPLPATQIPALLPKFRPKPIGKQRFIPNKLHRPRSFRRLPQLLLRVGIQTISYVLLDCAGKYCRLLVDEADLLADAVEV